MTSSNDQNKKWDEDVWVCDSAATCNMHWSLKGFLNIKLKNETIEVGDGETIGIKGRGTYIGNYVNSGGETKNITLNNCAYAPTLKYNLFSVQLALKNGSHV